MAWSETEYLDGYPHKPTEAADRGLILHDEAWHWAMPAIHGDRYETDHPELVHPSPDCPALESPSREQIRTSITLCDCSPRSVPEPGTMTALSSAGTFVPITRATSDSWESGTVISGHA
ncbi:hypothetical protein [Streptomyces sp. NPDC096339]|uniref:hypothetical protein n=1 Tax=Streptomyces sp. NPDC096339 TaxID=3366086 RepID=UPI00381B4E39